MCWITIERTVHQLCCHLSQVFTLGCPALYVLVAPTAVQVMSYDIAYTTILNMHNIYQYNNTLTELFLSSMVRNTLHSTFVFSESSSEFFLLSR